MDNDQDLLLHSPSASSGVHALSLTDLSIGYSPRKKKLDDDHVSRLMEVVDQLPPILVDAETKVVIDGVHRIEAVRRVGRTHISALLFRGSDIEVFAEAIQANVKHGKPLSRDERRAAAQELLARCPNRSDRWVAEVCGLSHSTVGSLRQLSRETVSPVRIGRDGRRRPVDPSAGQAAVVSILADNPGATIRQAAGIAGVAPSTVHRVAAAATQLQAASSGAGSLNGGRAGRIEEDLAFQASPERAEAAAWLKRTSIMPEDLHVHLENVPLSRVYEVVDECRRRALTWMEIANNLEARVREGSFAASRHQ